MIKELFDYTIIHSCIDTVTKRQEVIHTCLKMSRKSSCMIVAQKLTSNMAASQGTLEKSQLSTVQDRDF